MTNHLTLRRFLHNKKALGAPVGNLIILVAAVILSTTVVLFATNVTSSQVQKEKMYIATSHIWYVNSSTSIAAIAVCNTGPIDIVLNKIDVKGLICEWNGTNNYVVYTKINGTMPGDLPFTSDISQTENTTIPIAHQDYEFQVAGEGLTVKSGWSIAFYIVVPERVMVYDLSTPLRMVITTTQSLYITETLVQTT
ncbi:MAG: hypothetical protein ACFCUE_03825 [Candidatus Bathyarchaeia archaeon]